MGVPSRNASPSSSSASSAFSLKAAEMKPFASTSTFQEVDLQPMIEQPKHVGFISSISLNDATAGTQSVHLDPSRDGVYARMRSNALRFGSSAVIGSVIGVGGAVIGQRFIYNNSSEASMVTVNTTPQNSIDGGNNIINPI